MKTKTFLIFSLLLFVSSCLLYLVLAFRGEIEVRPDAYLGPVRLHLYGLMMALGILAGFLVIRNKFPKSEDFFVWTVIFGLVGARLYFVIFSWEYFRDNPWKIFQIWQGGFAIYGAIIGGLLGSYFFARKNQIQWLDLVNTAVLALPLGQAIGRFGNFFNQEAFGYPTDLPWKMYIAPGARPYEYLSSQYFHPTFLYEGIWDIFIFFLLLKWGQGQGRLGLYLVLYSIGRYFIESIRIDSFWAGGARVDQITALAMIILGAVLLLHQKKSNEIII